MSVNRTTRSPSKPETPNDEAARGDAPGDARDARNEAPTDTAGLASEADLRRELESVRDQHLRAVAEMRNLKIRSERDKAEALRYAEGDFAKELLTVLDDLDRTLETARSGADAAALVEGVRIVCEHFMKVLRARGIEPIEAQGAAFDPRFHEAMLQQPSADVPAQHVLQTLERGYRMHERVLRAARVIVSSGPAAKPAEPGQE